MTIKRWVRTLIALNIAWFYPSLQASVQESCHTLHAISLIGTPKYPADFQHFSYVNPDAPRQGKVRLAVLGTYDTFDLFSSKGVPAAVGPYIYDSLMFASRDELGSLYPMIAEAVEYPDDNRWVRFVINPKARFADGSPITAEVVSDTFLQYKNGDFSNFKRLLKDVNQIEVEPGNRVKLTLNVPEDKKLPFLLARLPIIHSSYWKKSEDVDSKIHIPVSSGAYTIKQYELGQTVFLERNKDYWAEKLPVNIGRNNFKQIRLEYFRNSTLSLEAFLSGHYDIRIENLAKNWTYAYKGKDVESGKIIKKNYPRKSFQVQSFIFNSRKGPFKDQRVREAISQGYDVAWTNANLLYGIYSAPGSLFANSDFAHSGIPDRAEIQLLEPYRDILPEKLFKQPWTGVQTDGTGNIRKQLSYANRLLKQAGWELKNGKRVNKETGEPLRFELMLAVPEQERVAIPFKSNLEMLGIEMQIISVDVSRYIQRVRNHDYDMLLRTFHQPDVPGNEQREYWSSSTADQQGTQNLAGVNHPAVDAMIESIIKAETIDQLQAATSAMDRILLWENYTIPQLYHRYWRVAHRSGYNYPDNGGLYGSVDLSIWWEKEPK
ncbi:extracellular solute-binding protein [Endozoicomonas sp. 8E]|uniref:extracellular solute-binding protein n=1 Tax=Endozoicomonas sp. 8E TaxID=3035692 RepID=UPI002938CFB5|nr:extracellular solute-binding protein [Endozoicomonas sp. 8E]WOG25351.1 extracellular solute-binding protein [Endozoicomonas sp. 8E]